jgi:hypothetical protein
LGVALVALGAGADPVISSELPVGQSPGGDRPAVAAGQGIYLVVWEHAPSLSQRPDLHGVRVRASDGVVLDAAPILIAAGASVQTEASVAFDGTNFLVVWTDIENAPVILGARVRASDGAVLDAQPLLISRPYSGPYSGLPQFNPSVSFDGTNYMVVWHGYVYESRTVVRGVLGTRVRPSDGQPIETNSFLIAHEGNSARVAFGGGVHLVVFQQNGFILGRRLDVLSGPRPDSPIFLVSSPAEHGAEPDVASDGSRFLVVWNGPSNRLTGNRVSASTGSVLDGAGFTVAMGSTQTPAVAFDGHDYRVSWQGPRNGAMQLFNTRVSPEGAAAPELFLSNVRLAPHAMDPANLAAVGAGRFVVTYTQHDTMTGLRRARMRLVTDLPPEQPCTTGQPTLVVTGGTEMTLECGSGPYIDLGAQAWDGCGNPLQVHAYNAGNDESGPGPRTTAEGTYTVQYVAWDALGQTVSAVRTVNVDDRTAPTLRLKGPAFMTHTCGSEFVDPGYESTDACYTNVAQTVRTTGYANGWAEGVYTLRYEVTDSGGNSAASLTRTVEVIDCPW